MPIFYGFSTQHVDKVRPSLVDRGADGGLGQNAPKPRVSRKFRTTDEQLVIQDFINALNFPQGQKVGNPGYGTTLWTFIFDPNVLEVRTAIEDEIRRVAAQDPRLQVNSVATSSHDHGILLEVELAVTPFNNAQTLGIYFDQKANSAYGV